MACNIATQRRRQKWQNFQPENSPCICDMGFAIAGCVARQWWVRWDTPQVDTKWLWLNAGFVLTYHSSAPGPSCLYQVKPTATETIDFRIFGFQPPLDHPSLGTISVQSELQIRTDILFPLPTSSFVDTASTGLYQPEPTATFSFSLFTTIIPIPGLPSTIVGQAFVTPLKPCHNCT